MGVIQHVITVLLPMSACSLYFVICNCVCGTYSRSASFAVSVDVIPTRHNSPGPILLTSFPSTCPEVHAVRCNIHQQESGRR